MVIARSVLSTTRLNEDEGSTAPVALLLHGYGSHEHDLTALAQWLPGDMAWGSLRAPLDMPGGGAAWFELPGADWKPDRSVVDASTAAIWDWVAEHVAPGAPLVPVGFSQGGMMALELLRSRPDRIAATVVLAGFVAPDDHPGDGALAAARPPVFWGRGDEDQVIARDLVDHTTAWLPQHADATVKVYAGLPHSINEEEMDDVRAFLRGCLEP